MGVTALLIVGLTMYSQGIKDKPAPKKGGESYFKFVRK